MTYTYLPVLLLMSFLYVRDNQHLFDGWGTLIWLVAFATHFMILRLAEFGDKEKLFLWHVAGMLLIVALCGHEAFWRVQSAGFADTWRQSAALLIPLLFGGAILMLRRRVAWPLMEHWPAYRAAAALLVLGQLLMLLGTASESPGNPAPLAYIPLLNPFDILTVLGLGVAYWAIRITRIDLSHGSIHKAFALLGLLVFLLTTLMVVRISNGLSSGG